MTHRPYWRSVLAAVAVQACLGSSSFATTIPVTTFTDAVAVDGFCSLREAIDAANTDAPVDTCAAGSGADTITLPAGTYTIAIPGTSENANLNGDLDILGSLEIAGGGTSSTVIDGGAIERVLDVDPLFAGYVVSISDLTVQNGNELFGGGGGISSGGQLTLTRVTVTGNAVDATLGDGGGILNDFGSMTIVDSTISGNSAPGSLGGGIQSNAPLTISGSTISGNVGGDGGGIETEDTLTITNSTITGNRALGYGGGIEVSLGLTSLANVTIASNVADDDNDDDGDGGGIDILDTVDMKNSILSGNSDTGIGPDCNGTLNSLDYNLIKNTTGCSFTGTITNNITGFDANLNPLSNTGGFTQTQVPRLCSPAVDAADPAGCTDSLLVPLATDQRGVTRPQGAICDIGAAERSASDVDQPRALNFRLSGYKRVRPGGVLTYVARYRELDIPNNLTLTLPDGIYPTLVFPSVVSIAGNTLTWFDVKIPSGKVKVKCFADLALVPGTVLAVSATVTSEICGDVGTAQAFTTVITPGP